MTAWRRIVGLSRYRRPDGIVVAELVVRQPEHAAARNIDEVELAGSLVTGASEHDAAPVARPGEATDVPARVLDELPLTAPVRAHHVNRGLALRDSNERDLAAVRRPDGVAVLWPLRQGLLLAPVRTHSEHLRTTTVPLADECDRLAVGGPVRRLVEGGIVGQPVAPGAVGVLHVDVAGTVAVAVEHDLLAVGRPASG